MSIYSWYEKCANIIKFMEEHFDFLYRIVLKFDKGKYYLSVEKVRNDKGTHQGSVVIWFNVSGEDFDSLPDKLLDKAKLEVFNWQKDALDKVQRIAKELQEAKQELEKRLKVGEGLNDE
jgi:hypothetical protein